MSEPSHRLPQDALRRVLAVARKLGASDHLDEILGVIIDAMRDLLRADRATVFEYDKAANQLFTTVAHGLSGGDASACIRIPATAGIAGQCAQSRAIINVPDAYADARFNQAVDRSTGYRTRSILTIPLEVVGGDLIGVAQVLNKDGGPFDGADEEIAGALAAQAAVAIRRARLLEDRLMREKLERDIELARRMQQQTFPTSVPRIPGYDIAGFSEPADQTGGDAFDLVGFVRRGQDLIVVEPNEPATGAMMFLADATGHGLGPALSVTQARSMLRMGLRVGVGVRSIAEHMNRQLCDDLPAGRFITAWIGLLDQGSHTLLSFSAGQAPLLHHRARDDEIVSVPAQTMPFGIMPDLDADVAPPLALEPGDAFIVLSDGFYEAARPSGEQFGEQRVYDLVRASRGLSASELLANIRAACREFTGPIEAADDQTAIIVKRLEWPGR
ncbi:MAG: SpoIIE family protein phosphatase [Phycisphaerales bacterium]|nr:SpoIIE family protein phosphatase [Phycisphaerales bacterium]